MRTKLGYLLSCLSLWLMPLTGAEEKKAETKVETESKCAVQEVFSETAHEVVVDGKSISYKAIAGTLLLKDDKCDPKASLFFISYTKDGVDDLSQRPVTFCFNGGPGSSSVWLHMGTFGPKRVALTDNGDALPPYHLVDNEFSILDVTDLVFIDPVSTGYSRAIPADTAKDYHGVEEDIKSVAEFIRLYITRYNRWESPKFIAGESYGTTRAAGLAGYLHDQYYVNVNGLVLVSSVLNFQSIDFSVGNDLSYLLFLPSYTATAWYHKKLPADLQNASLDEVLKQARDFVTDDYSTALFKGDLLTSEQRKNMVQKLARFTGLTPDYIERSNLRIDMMRYAKELLRTQRRTVGRFDSRFQGIDIDAVGEYFEYDPSADAIFGAFTATFNHYVRTDLKWEKDTHYKILTNVQPWKYGNGNQYLNVAENLRSVMTKNPYMRVFVANGYYDLATPFFATEYTFNHLGLDPSFPGHVTMTYYDAGHMMYIYRPALIQLKRDLAQYYLKTLESQEEAEKSGDQIRR
ncbi:carboxypeptidase family protein [Candidatus Protochlamydia naegleriophila]|uniref:Carboxypeptidase family protein n=1 Tax=Candidatus Protochlamydia naegleriophila TaxID=389348 RepID=A0A0U5JBM9_9BACT|nr:peptidase S10 [Candidatus Protochlamydia naegleriophila]CUI17449.1 carboxypeptidase family protein [Candidatus Protochlamydia naegleriophila]